MSEHQLDKMLTPQEVADRLGVSRHAVYAMYREKRIPVVRLSTSNLRIRESDLQAFIEARTQPAESGDAA